jgi:hypothetical protein
VCAETDCDARFGDLLRDPLIRLVMASDGVTEQEMLALRDQLRRAYHPAPSARAISTRSAIPTG